MSIYVFEGNARPERLPQAGSRRGNRLRTLTRPLPDDPPSVALTERVTLVAKPIWSATMALQPHPHPQ